MKIATRYLLPLEIFMAVLLLSWGLSGWTGGEGDYLWQALERTGQNTAWGAVLCFVGGVQLAVTLLEWFVGRRWPNSHVLRSVSARQFSAFISCAVWVYVLYTVATLPEVFHIGVLMVQAPAGIGFSIWIFIQNMKVACVLDPAVPTQRLQRELQLEREQAAVH